MKEKVTARGHEDMMKEAMWLWPSSSIVHVYFFLSDANCIYCLYDTGNTDHNRTDCMYSTYYNESPPDPI